MKLRHVLVVVSIAVVIGCGVQATPASAATSGDFVSSINSLRASKGLGSLVVDSRLQAKAQAWAESMAAAGKISHNPTLGATSGGWAKIGENVGVGGDVSGLMSAFVASPHHYENLVDGSYNSVGVGVAVGSDGRLYTTHDFANYPGAGGGATKAASSPSSAASKSSTTAAAKAAAAKSAATARAQARAKAAQATTTTAAPAPAPAPVEAAPAPAPAPAPVLPAPSNRIVQGLAEVGSISTQG